MYGGRYDWHTLEGPCVVARDGRYYCFYSGGRWDTRRYGIDFAVASNVLGPYDATGSESGPRVLWSSEGLRGPGHNSLVVGPDGVTDHIAYHAWSSDLTKRQLHIDALEWTERGPRVISPTFPLRSESARD
jgi:GH43 family beta-xylosidase